MPPYTYTIIHPYTPLHTRIHPYTPLYTLINPYTPLYLTPFPYTLSLPNKPTGNHLLVVFLVVESVLFGLFTLCMMGDQVPSYTYTYILIHIYTYTRLSLIPYTCVLNPLISLFYEPPLLCYACLFNPY
jgi:hypothetical protein